MARNGPDRTSSTPGGEGGDPFVRENGREEGGLREGWPETKEKPEIRCNWGRRSDVRSERKIQRIQVSLENNSKGQQTTKGRREISGVITC